MNRCFEGKNMTYKMVQNLVRSNNQIKKSTFWPTLVRDFGLDSYQKGLNCHNFWFTVRSCCIYLLPLFGFKNHNFHPFLNFYHYFDVLIRARQNTLSTISIIWITSCYRNFLLWLLGKVEASWIQNLIYGFYYFNKIMIRCNFTKGKCYLLRS